MYFSGSNTAFYEEPLFSDCVEVPVDLPATFQEKLEKDPSLYISSNADGYPVLLSRLPPGPATKEDVFKMRVTFLNSQYEAAVAALRDTYPQAETSTWPVQIDEAKRYRRWESAGSTGDAPSTPFLTDLTAARDARGVGAGLADLVARILNNDAIYSPAMATLTAIRHKAEQDLYIAFQAGEISDLREVTWSFQLTLNAEPTDAPVENPA